jgi:hypothetical protein
VNFWAALIPLKGYEKAEPDSAMQKRSLLVVAIAAVDLLIPSAADNYQLGHPGRPLYQVY